MVTWDGPASHPGGSDTPTCSHFMLQKWKLHVRVYKQWHKVKFLVPSILMMGTHRLLLQYYEWHKLYIPLTDITTFLFCLNLQEYGFVPQTYILPYDFKLLKRAWDDGSSRQKWILKPVINFSFLFFKCSGLCLVKITFNYFLTTWMELCGHVCTRRVEKL